LVYFQLFNPFWKLAMKCELCKQAEARQAIRRTINQEEQELYVCEACAAAQNPKQEKPVVSLEASPEVLEVIKETLPEIMGMILGATVEFSGPIPSPGKETICPLCGMTRSEYKKIARLGCAQCYETFIKDLDSVVGEMHRSPRHIGKGPTQPRPSSYVNALKERLRKAEADSRVIEAEDIRTRIRQLGWDPETLKGQP
jgi:protein arginine kinase activator